MGFDRLACPIGGAFELCKIQIPTYSPTLPGWGVVGHNIDRCIIATCFFIAECLSMRHIILRGRRVPTVEHAVCIYIYLFIYRFVRIHSIVNDKVSAGVSGQGVIPDTPFVIH